LSTISRHFFIAGLFSLSVLGAAPEASAQDVRVMDSAPKASAEIEGRSSEFFVRFDRPIDHIHSQLAITRNGQLVEKLVPRLESAPEVLYARAPTLPAGSYDLNWRVKTMTGVDVIQGNIPFSVKP
jgi:methionine-rich copper-binding protein CopC